MGTIRKQTVRPLPLLAAGLLFLSGCGGGNPTPTPPIETVLTASPTPSAAPTPAPTPTAGEAENAPMRVFCLGEEHTGFYTGQTECGVPDGTGIFRSVTDEGVSFTYTGEWKNGAMDGQGEMCFASEAYRTRTGTFTEGVFTPTAAETIRSIGMGMPGFTLTAEQEAYLELFPEVWDEENDHLGYYEDSAIKAGCDRKQSLETCWGKESFRTEPTWVDQLSCRILESHTESVGENGGTFTVITAMEQTYTKVMLLLVPGEITDFTYGCRIHVHALPLAMSSYVTAQGESRDCLVALVGDLDKAYMIG